MSRLYKTSLVMWIVIYFLTGCSMEEHSHHVPVVKDGVINLESWNFDRDGIVKLGGEWEFYWKQLLDPTHFEHTSQDKDIQFLQVPSFWNDSERIQTGTGYGTYRVEVQVDKLQNGRLLALYMPLGIETAHKLWVNGELMASVGKVGTSKSDMIGQYRPQVIIFSAQEKIEVVIQVSNYLQRTGGIADEIRIGPADDLVSLRDKRLAQEIFVTGSIIIMGLYHVGLYLIRRKDPLPLYFGVFCLLIGLRSLFLGEALITQVFPNFNFEVYKKIVHFGQYLGTALFILYVQSLFPSDMNKKFVQLSVAAHAVLSAIVLVTPSTVFTYTLSISHIMLLICVPYVIYVFIVAAIRKREGALLCCALFLVMAVTVVNDILYYNNFIKSIDMSKYGLFVFIFAQSFILSTKFSRAFTAVEELTEEIEIAQKEIIFTLGEIVETRSRETGFHVNRVAEYTKLLALKYGLSEREAELIRLASPMHDVGKVGISDDILNKPGKLTPAEYEIMKTHTRIGYEMLKHSSQNVIKAAAIIALQHHEKYNGQGYPNGLKGEEIHLYGRLTAIADVFDALASDRVYKKAWELNHVISFFKEQRGEHFDPVLVDLFLEHLDEFVVIRETYRDDKVF